MNFENLRRNAHNIISSIIIIIIARFCHSLTFFSKKIDGSIHSIQLIRTRVATVLQKVLQDFILFFVPKLNSKIVIIIKYGVLFFYFGFPPRANEPCLSFFA